MEDGKYDISSSIVWHTLSRFLLEIRESDWSPMVAIRGSSYTFCVKRDLGFLIYFSVKRNLSKDELN